MMNLMQVTEHEKTARKRIWIGMTIGVILIAALLWCTMILSQGSILWYLDSVSLLAILATLYGLILVLFILPVMGRLNSYVKCGKIVP